MEKITLTIDNAEVSVPKGFTIMQAAEQIGIRIPRLCYHSRLSEFGACRVCVVEVEGMKNYPPSCATKASDGMKVRTNSKGIQRARRNIVELILNSHKGECTSCVKNGNCELQELAENLGIKDFVREGEQKNYPVDDSSLCLVKDSDKCILCGKCVRVCSEVQGVNTLTFSHRGFKTNIVPAYGMNLEDSVCVNCGQCSVVCPTGAIVERDDTDRIWQNIHDPEKTVIVQIAPAVRVAVGEGFGNEPGRDMTYETVTALRMMGFDVVFDTQFSADLTIVEEGNELIKRIKENGKLPMITSCSPGWIKFCESFYPEFLGNISSCKSPQQMMGSLIKTYYAKKAGLDPAKIYSVSIMPCTAKKFEAARPEMNASGCQDVDAVITTRELISMIKQSGIDFNRLKKGGFDSPMGGSTGAAPIFGVTGGVMEAALRTAYEVITGKTLDNIEFMQVRGLEGLKEASIDIAGMQVRVAVAHGLTNVQKLFDDIKNQGKKYHFIEIMCCPGGCLGGGGQPYPQGNREAFDKTVYQKRAEGLYRIDEGKDIRKSHENPDIKKVYEEFLEKPLGHMSHKLLHTHYNKRYPQGIRCDIEKKVNILR